MRFIPAAYDIQTMHIMSQGLFTNTSQSGPYRGAGRPEAAYFTERLIEHAARTIGMDLAEIRRRNLIPPDKLPYTTPTLWTYDSGEFVRLMDRCIEISDWKGYAARKKASEKSGKLRGRSVCYYIEFGGIFNDRMDMRFDPDGTLTVFAGTHSHGQGHATVFAQLVHELLGVPFEPIRYVQGDTAQVRDRSRHLRRAQRGRRRQRARQGRRCDHREGQADGRRHDGGGRGRHRIQGRATTASPAPTRRSPSSKSPRHPTRRWGR